MSKSSLRVLAVLLTVGIIVVLFAGLDGLPGAVKTQIAAEKKSFAAAQSQLEKAQADVSRTMAGEMALFWSPLPLPELLLLLTILLLQTSLPFSLLPCYTPFYSAKRKCIMILKALLIIAEVPEVLYPAFSCGCHLLLCK